MYITYAYMYYLPWNTSCIKEVFVLTHVQGESFIHVGSIESNGGGNHSVREKNKLYLMHDSHCLTCTFYMMHLSSPVLSNRDFDKQSYL